MDLNKVTVIGRLGKDPEVRYTQAGEPITSFSVAAGEKWTNKIGEKQERTEWFNVTAFGALAKIASEYLVKGKQVYLEGQLRTEEWTDKDGVKRRSTKVNLSGPRAILILLGGGTGNGESRSAAPAAGGGDGWVDEDIPF
jgi:single-strand DNA-binding protein